MTTVMSASQKMTVAAAPELDQYLFGMVTVRQPEALKPL